MAEVRAGDRIFTVLDAKPANTESDPPGPEPVVESSDSAVSQADWDLVSE
jgi:hypothetical protein